MLPNNNYIVRRFGTNKTQLLHRIRLRKFTPQAPLADIFVQETDWQKDDQMPITNDDLYAQSWNTNFGSNPFDDGPSEYSLNTEDTEYIPIQIPEENRTPSPGSSKNSEGSPVEQTTEPDENHENEIPQQIIEDAQSTQKIQKMQIFHLMMISKKPQKIHKIPHHKKNPQTPVVIKTTYALTPTQITPTHTDIKKYFQTKLFSHLLITGFILPVFRCCVCQ